MKVKAAVLNDKHDSVRVVVKWVAILFLPLYAIATSIGYYNDISYSSSLKVLSLFPLSLFFILSLIREIKKKNTTPFEKLVFGFLAVITPKALFYYFFHGLLESFPLDILLVVLLSVIHPLPLVIFYTTIILTINMIHMMTGSGEILLLQEMFEIHFYYCFAFHCGRIY